MMNGLCKIAGYAVKSKSTLWCCVVSIALTGCMPEGVESGSTAIGMGAVDLGLSVRWANCNVGAESPEEYGGYYSWGETEEKSSYFWEDYMYIDSTNYDGWCDEDEMEHIGYEISNTSYDVAHVKWGNGWRMPTESEFDELVNDCSWEWTKVKGVGGYRITGPNGNSIFLPAASYRAEDWDGKDGEGIYGFYWSSNLYGGDYSCAYGVLFEYYRADGEVNEDLYFEEQERCLGACVRPVRSLK